MTSFKKLIRCICFLTIFTLGFMFISDHLVRQSNIGAWNYTVKVGGFYKQEAQSIEMIGLGSSHMYCTMSPNEIWKDAQINSYVLSTQEQSLLITYHYLLEVLKTQSPKVIVLETHMFNSKETKFNDAAVSNAIEPLIWSKNKMDLIFNVVPDASKVEYIFPLLKYHGIWTTLDLDYLKDRYKGQTDPFRGYVFLNETHDTPSFIEHKTPIDIEIQEESIHALQDIINLTNEKEIPLLLLHAPSGMDEKTFASQAYLKQYAQSQNIRYLDMNEHLDDVGLILDEDFFDGGHLNVNGAQKASRYLSDYVQTFVDFDKVYSQSVIKELDEAYETYAKALNPIEE